MKDYTVEITMTIPITAKNQEQAEERANQMQEWIEYNPPKNKPWAQQDIALDSVVTEAQP